MSAVVHVTPHADDETLGCGGTLLGHVDRGDRVHWLIVTELDAVAGYSDEAVARREREIESVAAAYGFAGVHRLRLPDARLDTLPLLEVAAALRGVLAEVRPATVYLPFRGDAHSDHRVVFDAATACLRPHRAPWARRVLAYETPSETDFALAPGSGFVPNLFVDVGDRLERKIEILRLYAGSELGDHPFPRSEQGVRALATVRGAAAGVAAAEAFMLLRQVERDG